MRKLQVFDTVKKRWFWKNEDEFSGGGSSDSIPPANLEYTIDDTTYDNPYNPSEKMRVLVLPDDLPAIAIAVEGDAFPRWVIFSDAGDGMYFGDGTFDATSGDGGNLSAAGNGVGANAFYAGNSLVTAGTFDAHGDVVLMGSIIKMTSLPTEDPHNTGQLWVDNDAGGVIKRSAS